MKKKKFLKQSMAGLLTVCMVAGYTPALPLVSVKAATEPELDNLVIAEIGRLTPEFSPEVTTYEAEAYMSVATLNIYPFKESSTDTVKIGKKGETATNVSGNNVSIPLTLGQNEIEVSVSNGTDTKVYTIHVNKLNSDYRGRVIIPNNEIEPETTFGGDLSLMFDGDVNTGWSPSVVPVDETEANPATSFIMDLGQTRWVSRMRADMAGSGYALWKNMVRISVSTDKEKWTPVVIKGNMREDQNNIRYEFGKSYEARYIKYEIIKFNSASLQINEMTVFEDSNGEFPTYDAPEDGNTQFIPTNENLSRGQEIVIQKGFPVSGWMPSGGYGRGTMTAEESALLGWDGPLFYDPELTNETFMQNNPDALWGIAKAPWGDNGMGNAGTPKDFVPSNLQPYIKNAVNFCFGDEGLYSRVENTRFKDWFDWSKDTYPGTIVHSNQAGGRGWEGNFTEYVQQTEADLLSFDDYYWHLNSNQWNGVYGLLNTTLWKQQREAALKGVDGTGEKPILFGQYLDVWDRDQPTSQKNLVTNLSILTGMKWLNYFRVEYQFDGCFLFDKDGTPTQGLYEWGEVNRYLKNIDDYILKLNNDYVVTKPGQHMNNGSVTSNNTASAWHMDGFANSTAKNAEYGIADVEAKNLNSSCNDGLDGDVVIGYFNALPGLSSEDIQGTFGCTSPKAFMLLNGLNDGTYARWNSSNVVGKEKGSTENTKQEITLTFQDVEGKNLKKVNHTTGEIEDIVITNNTLTTTIGGGEADLYFWEENLEADATSTNETKEAKFAFDGIYGTSWEAEQGQTASELTNTFDEKEIKKIIINEKGNAVEGYQVQYLDGETWKDITAAQGTTIGASKVITLDTPITATGLKLIITQASTSPAIKEIRTYSNAELGTGTYNVTTTVGENGTVDITSTTVNEHEDIVITASPSDGFMVDKATADKVIYSADDNVILIPDVTANKSVAITFTEEMPEIVDRGMLQTTIDEALALNKLNYIGSSWETLSSKIKRAKEVIENTQASNSQRKSAYEGIVNAKNALVEAAATCPREGITETTSFIDNTDADITYTGSWANGEGGWTVNKYMNSQQFCDDASSASVQYTFIGTGIEAFVESQSQSANINVQILDKDGVQVAGEDNIICAEDASANNPPSLCKSIFTKTDLPYGEYTIKMTFAENASGNKRAALDGFLVTNTRGNVEVTDISLNKQELALNVNDTEELIATLTPEDVLNANITWGTDKPEVATVENGVVTAVGVGQATITASCNGKNAVCIVTVKNEMPTEPSETTYNVEYVEGEDTKAIKTGTFTIADGEYSQGHGGKHISSDETGAAVAYTFTGKAASIYTKTGSKAGIADIYVDNKLVARDDQYEVTQTFNRRAYTVVFNTSGEHTIKIVRSGEKNPASGGTGLNFDCFKIFTEQPATTPVTGVTVNPTSMSLKVKEAKAITATVAPADATNKKYTWSTSDATVAAVENGKVVAKKAGTATITVTTEDQAKKATCVVTVLKEEPIVIPVTGVTVNPTSMTLKVKEAKAITAMVAPADATNKNYTWSTTDATVAAVENGKVVAKKAGTATITVTTEDQAKTATCVVTVTEDPKVDKTLLEEAIKKAQTYKAEPYTTNSFQKLVESLANGKNVYQDENATIAQVEEATHAIEKAIRELVKVTIKNGWVEDSKGRKYYKNNKALTKQWFQDEDGTWYYLGTDGYMQTKWYKEGKTWYYLGTNGKMVTGWKQINKVWYLFGTNGKMKTGWQKSGTAWYYLKENGKMTTGWQQVNKIWYYMNTNGKMATGWKKIQNKWYYLKTSGAMQKGWVKDGKTWYYMNANGAMKTGWLQLGKTWYYLTEAGKMVTGWKVINGKCYFFNESGAWTGATK